jgi:hypothetical protein
MEQHRESVEPWAKAPRFLIRDASLSALQRLLLIDLLDRRGRGKAYAVVKRATLAADLGVTLSTLDRAIAGLVESGRIEARRSGRAVHYYPAESSILLGLSRQKCYVRVVKSDDSNKQESLEVESKQASSASERTGEPSEEQKKSAAAARPERAVKQAEAVTITSSEQGQVIGTRTPTGELGDPLQTVGDSLDVLAVLMAFPKHQQPSDKPHVTRAIRQALARGWAPAALHRAVADQITNPKAGPGLVVDLLKEVCQRAPSFAETREGAATATEQATTAEAEAAEEKAWAYAWEAVKWATGQQPCRVDRDDPDVSHKPRNPSLFHVPNHLYGAAIDSETIRDNFALEISKENPRSDTQARAIAEQIAPRFIREDSMRQIACAVAAVANRGLIPYHQARSMALEMWHAAHELLMQIGEYAMRAGIEKLEPGNVERFVKNWPTPIAQMMRAQRIVDAMTVIGQVPIVDAPALTRAVFLSDLRAGFHDRGNPNLDYKQPNYRALALSILPNLHSTPWPWDDPDRQPVESAVEETWLDMMLPDVGDPVAGVAACRDALQGAKA